MAGRISEPKPAQHLPSRKWSCSELTAGLKHVLDDATAGDLEDVQARCPDRASWFIVLLAYSRHYLACLPRGLAGSAGSA